MNFEFYFRTISLSIGLAMDACVISMGNGLSNKNISKQKVLLMALIFAVFQAIMPIIGFFIGYLILGVIKDYIPYIALFLLTIIGYKMIIEGIRKNEKETEKTKELTFFGLIIQAIATSIDALSIGITFAEYSLVMMILSTIFISIITFFMCLLGFFIGKKFGNVLGNKSEILGGVILIIIGLEIFVASVI